MAPEDEALGSGAALWPPSKNRSPLRPPMSSGSKAKFGMVRCSAQQGAWPHHSPLAAASTLALSMGSRGSLWGAASQEGVLCCRVVLLPSVQGSGLCPHPLWGRLWRCRGAHLLPACPQSQLSLLGLGLHLPGFWAAVSTALLR